MLEVDGERDRGLGMRVAVLQPDIDARERWDPTKAAAILDKLVKLTRDAERDGAKLTVWPEAAYPYPVLHGSKRARDGEFAMVPPGVRGPVLAGLIMQTGAGPTNSAVIATADGAISESADKVNLVPFGETIPFADRIAGLGDLIPGGAYVAGQAHGVLRSGLAQALVFNCVEDALPGSGRDALDAEPNLLVSVTNDAWFAGTKESEEHLRIAAMRSIELRRDLVRAVNGGVAGWVDAAGRVRARIPGDSPGYALADVRLVDEMSPIYARFGDLPWVVLLGALVYRFVRRPRGAARVAPSSAA
jgi:apolipoprotein N-acyltransferase